jgi:hypothetical protein
LSVAGPFEIRSFLRESLICKAISVPPLDYGLLVNSGAIIKKSMTYLKGILYIRGIDTMLCRNLLIWSLIAIVGIT